MNTPVIAGFYPDPSICRAGDTYYTAHSSFEYVPGVPIFRSTDLLTWVQVANALTSPPHLPATEGTAGSGIYAPTIRHAQGRFWITTTDISRIRQGHLIVSAENPTGPWSEPVFVTGTLGIDPDLMWDDDGICRITWKSFHPANPGILSAPIDPATGVLLAEPQSLWQGTGLQAAEGPHLYRIDGWWYLLLAEGGTERGHAVTIARAEHLDGPWETTPTNPILTHRSTDHPVQNVGHADLVETPDGAWAMVYHGVRPGGQTPHFHVNGRETFLAGIDWVDGWPVVDADRYPVEAVDHSFVDRFDTPDLHSRWIAPGVAPTSFSTPTDAGLVVRPDAVLAGGPALVATRTRDEEWDFEAQMSGPYEESRVILRMDPDHWYAVTVTRTEIRATLAIGPSISIVASVPRGEGDVVVRISAMRAPGGSMGGPDEPDVIELAATTGDTDEHVFGSFDGRYLSTEVAGGFTGRVVGVEAVRGPLILRRADYRTRTSARRRT